MRSPQTDSELDETDRLSNTHSREPKLKKFKPSSSKLQQLNSADAVEIFQLRPNQTDGESSRRGSLLFCKSVAPKYGVSPKTIRDIWRCRTWSHATEHLWNETEKKLHSEHTRMKKERKKILQDEESKNRDEEEEAVQMSTRIEADFRNAAREAPQNDAIETIFSPQSCSQNSPNFTSFTLRTTFGHESHNSKPSHQHSLPQIQCHNPFLGSHLYLASAPRSEPIISVPFPTFGSALFNPAQLPLLPLLNFLGHNRLSSLPVALEPRLPPARPAFPDAFWPEARSAPLLHASPLHMAALSGALARRPGHPGR